MKSESGFSWAMASQPYNIKHFLGYSRDQLIILLVWTWLMHFCPAPQSLCSKHCLISLKKTSSITIIYGQRRMQREKCVFEALGAVPDNSLLFCSSRQKFVCLLSSFATHSAETSVRKMNYKNCFLFKLWIRSFPTCVHVLPNITWAPFTFAFQQLMINVT